MLTLIDAWSAEWLRKRVQQAIPGKHHITRTCVDKNLEPGLPPNESDARGRRLAAEGVVPFRFPVDEVAVAGGEDGFTVPVLVELGSRGLRDRRDHSPGEDHAPGIIDEPLPRFRIQPVPQLLYSHDGNSHPFVMPVYENAAPAPIPGTLARASPTIRGHYGAQMMARRRRPRCPLRVHPRTMNPQKGKSLPPGAEPLPWISGKETTAD